MVVPGNFQLESSSQRRRCTQEAKKRPLVPALPKTVCFTEIYVRNYLQSLKKEQRPGASVDNWSPILFSSLTLFIGLVLFTETLLQRICNEQWRQESCHAIVTQLNHALTCFNEFDLRTVQKSTPFKFFFLFFFGGGGV